ncbi:hypothetical protein BGZ95_003418 [Linnemannia exigua]|uniref:S-adenosyl-L-methionine-dependent methyltransferase n=1 Tax=Linnemannia exigua TaxID=604196 RepID=A0AAD4H2B4_9FUNG|nr:hypothetical protein BGZ95_003418 [Linnemannia exigua]
MNGSHFHESCIHTPLSSIISNNHSAPSLTSLLATTTITTSNKDIWHLSGPFDQENIPRQHNEPPVSLLRRTRTDTRQQQGPAIASSKSRASTFAPPTLITTMLMIEGPKFASFDFSSSASQSGEPYKINGHRIVLPPKEESSKDKDEDNEPGLQDTEGKGTAELSHTASTAKSVWDCSIVLGKYLEALSNKTPGFWKGKRVLELGAGQGIVSLSAAALGAERVIMTDIDSAVPALQRGVHLNRFEAPQVQVTALDWTNRSHALQHIWNDLLLTKDETTLSTTTVKPQLDYILASDVIWVDYLVPALVETIADLMHISKERRDSGTHHHLDERPTLQPRPPVLLLAYQFRSTRSDQLLFDSLDGFGLQRKKIRLDNDGEDKDDDPDSVYMDPNFRKPNLAIWKVWKE